MATIAFIGSDGAGKTTIIRMIQNEFPDEAKYMYMGLNLESSNYSLPTSRLILRFKLRSLRKEAAENGNTDPKYLSTHHISHRTLVRGRAVKALRTINRILEAGVWLLPSATPTWWRTCRSSNPSSPVTPWKVHQETSLPDPSSISKAGAITSLGI